MHPLVRPFCCGRPARSTRAEYRGATHQTAKVESGRGIGGEGVPLSDGSARATRNAEERSSSGGQCVERIQQALAPQEKPGRPILHRERIAIIAVARLELAL